MTEEELIVGSKDFLHSCTWHFLRERGMDPSIYYSDVFQEAAIAYLLWYRKLNSGRCPPDWKNFAKSSVRFHLLKRFRNLSSVHVPHHVPSGQGQTVSFTFEPEDEDASTDGGISSVFVRDFIAHLTPIQRQYIMMRAAGYRDSVIGRMLNKSHNWSRDVRQAVQRKAEKYFEAV